MIKRTIFLLPLLLIMSLGPVKAEETLRFFIWEGYAPEPMLEEFKEEVEEKYSITLSIEVEFLTSADQIFHILRSRRADIITPSHNLFKDEKHKLISNRLLLPIESDLLDNMPLLTPPFRDVGALKNGSDSYGLPFAFGPYGLAFNSETAPPPTTWNVLWENGYEGDFILTGEYYETNFYITALALGYPVESLSQLETYDNSVFRRKFRDLISRAGGFWRGVDRPVDLMGYSLAGVWGFALTDLHTMGQDWRISSPREGTMFWLDTWALSATLRDNPVLLKIAYDWLDKTISPAYQQAVVYEKLGVIPVIQTVNYADNFEQSDWCYGFTEAMQMNIIQKYLWPNLSQRVRNFMLSLWSNSSE